MVTESFQSPNAIPPRTSSTGLNIGFTAAKPVLRPVPESTWIGHGKKPHSSSISSTKPLAMHQSKSNGGAPSAGTWSEEKEKILCGPYDYMVNQPGKDIRKQMIAAFNAWLNVPEKSLTIITKVVGMLHTASLL